MARRISMSTQGELLDTIGARYRAADRRQRRRSWTSSLRSAGITASMRSAGSVANLTAVCRDWFRARECGRAMSDFKGRHFDGEIVLWAVRWYCRYGVSYRDLEQMMGEASRLTIQRSTAGFRGMRPKSRNGCVGSGRRSSPQAAIDLIADVEIRAELSRQEDLGRAASTVAAGTAV